MTSYFSYEVNVSITVKTDVPTTFPAVTICNLNPFDNDDPEVQKIVKEVLLTRNFTDSSIPINVVEKRLRLLKIKSKQMVKENVQADKLGDPNIEKNRDLGYEIDRILLSCSFDGVICSSSDFASYYSYEYGNCYIFNFAYNTANLRTVTRTKTGLRMEIFTGIPGNLLQIIKNQLIRKFI